MLPLYNQISRKTKETEVNLEFEQVAPLDGNDNTNIDKYGTNIRYILNIQVKGDFVHHVIEDAMIALNELAKNKGVGHHLTGGYVNASKFIR